MMRDLRTQAETFGGLSPDLQNPAKRIALNAKPQIRRPSFELAGHPEPQNPRCYIPDLPHTMYLLISFRKSSPTQNRQPDDNEQ